MVKPGLFIVGAPKCATTSLYSYLGQHPQIFCPAIKEPGYFGEGPSPMNRFKTLEAYLGLYQSCPIKAIAADATTNYLIAPSAVQQIRDFNPEAKIVICLRDPIDRAYSHYWMNLREGFDSIGRFDDALAAEPGRGPLNFYTHYVACGMYFQQVKRCFDVFGKNSVRVYLDEEIKKDADAVCKNVCRLLGLDDSIQFNTTFRANEGGRPRSRLIATIAYNRGLLWRVARVSVPKVLRRKTQKWLANINRARDIPPMRPETYQRLQRTFAPDIRQLEILLGRDLSAWCANPPLHVKDADI